MSTVIMHFHNEEYLLPWWINHHKKLFDDGILINYHSTDRSVEICKELCPPHWQIVDTVNNDFSVDPIDTEIKMYEKSVVGFKMTLTATEFLLTPIPLLNLNRYIIDNKFNYIKTFGVCMVDMYPDDLPTYDEPLYAKKHHGMLTGYRVPTYAWGPDTYFFLYSRYYHNQPFGKYRSGRHEVDDDNQKQMGDIFILKYKYSPWNRKSIDRIQQFVPLLVKSDLDQLKVTAHNQTEEEHMNLYNHFMTTAYDLKTNPHFLAAHNYCMSL